MKTKTNTIRKLKGLPGTEERLYFVQIGSKENTVYFEGQMLGTSKIYFGTLDEAINCFKYVAGNNPIVLKGLVVASYLYNNVQPEENEKIFVYRGEGEIILGSEVMTIYNNKLEAIEAKTRKEGELKKRDEQAKKTNPTVVDPF